MGGLAIATVATQSLLRGAAACSVTPGVSAELTLIAGITWWGATLLIPRLSVLFALRLARASVARPAAGGAAIFPPGMYAVASQRLSTEIGAAAIDRVGRAFFWVALIGWVGAGAANLAASCRRTTTPAGAAGSRPEARRGASSRPRAASR